MKHVAILGGGPAGAMTAERLASAGLPVTLLDEKLAWEKPCGGGVTSRAYRQYPFLIENDKTKRMVGTGTISESRTGSVDLSLTDPMLIYSRVHLNGMMLERAARAGARVEKTRVTGLERHGSRWAVRTKHGLLDADHVVVATGARNSLDQVGTKLGPEDTMLAMGYYVPGEQKHFDIHFFPKFEGYIWIFPRHDHLSIGICGKGESAQAMKARLDAHLSERGIGLKDAVFYGHVIPALETVSFRSNRVAGEGWSAVGDAAGLVDPVTGEGLYYAFRSGDLASRVLLDSRHEPGARADAYRALLQHDFLEDLTFGAGLAKRFFLQRFLMSTVPARMIEFMRRSPAFRIIVSDLFAGTQGYRDLKRRLLHSLNGSIWEYAMGAVLGIRVVQEAEG